jgi:hypothetical protein
LTQFTGSLFNHEYNCYFKMPYLFIAKSHPVCYDLSMQNIISMGEPVVQQLTHEWYGNAIAAPVEYSFTVEGEYLVFRASQAAPVSIHPEAVPGEFKEELWMYDTAEFFVADADAKQYLEFNLCPNGAWWPAHSRDRASRWLAPGCRRAW